MTHPLPLGRGNSEQVHQLSASGNHAGSPPDPVHVGNELITLGHRLRGAPPFFLGDQVNLAEFPEKMLFDVARNESMQAAIREAAVELLIEKNSEKLDEPEIAELVAAVKARVVEPTLFDAPVVEDAFVAEPSVEVRPLNGQE